MEINHLLPLENWIVFNFLRELKSAPKCVPNVPLEGPGGLRFPLNTLWIAQFLVFLSKKESLQRFPIPNPHRSCLGWVCALAQLCSPFLGFIPNPFLLGWCHSLFISQISAQDTGSSCSQESKSHSLCLYLEVFSWNFESIPPFSLEMLQPRLISIP